MLGGLERQGRCLMETESRSLRRGGGGERDGERERGEGVQNLRCNNLCNQRPYPSPSQMYMQMFVSETSGHGS